MGQPWPGHCYPMRRRVPLWKDDRVSQELRLLTLDDSLDFVSTLLAEVRSQGYEPVHFHADTAAAMETALDESPWDVVIADYSMPHFRAAAALELKRRRALDVPVIVMSDTLGREVALAALRAGAQDYLLKSQMSWIGLVIERALRESCERQRRQRAEEALRQSGGRAASEPPRKVENLVVLCDVRGTVTSCSDELLELLGYEPDDVVGRNWIQYFLPRDERERAEEAFLEVLSKGSTEATLDIHVVTLLGMRRAVRWKNAALVDAQGKIVGTASIGRTQGEDAASSDELAAFGAEPQSSVAVVTH
jgi:PAS domain S-box-containing protein